MGKGTLRRRSYRVPASCRPSVDRLLRTGRWLRDLLGERDGQTVWVDTDSELDPFAFALSGWHDKSRAFGFQFLIGFVHIFDVEPNRARARIFISVSLCQRIGRKSAAV